MLTDHVDVGSKRNAATGEPLAPETGAQAGQVELEHGLDLAGRRRPLKSGLDQAHERMDRVVGGDRRSGLQRPDQLDARARQADLLLRLAQRGQAQVGLVVVLTPARERDLARVAAKVVMALGEDGVQRAVAHEQGDEDGSVDASMNVERRGVGRIKQDCAQQGGDLSARA